MPIYAAATISPSDMTCCSRCTYGCCWLWAANCDKMSPGQCRLGAQADHDYIYVAPGDNVYSSTSCGELEIVIRCTESLTKSKTL
jgi:hypothetical protein